MNDLPALPIGAVALCHHKIVTTSLVVSEVFGKNHQHVLRDIRALNQPKSGPVEDANAPKSGGVKEGDRSKSGRISDPIDAFWRLNFQPRTYVDAMNRTQDMFEITKDGFALLVMGYSGEKALLFKIAYITEFNAMAQRLKGDGSARFRLAETWYFNKYPERLTIRQMTMQGEPYWYISRALGRSVSAIGRAVGDMLKAGMMTRDALDNARQFLGKIWAAYRRQEKNQTPLLWR